MPDSFATPDRPINNLLSFPLVPLSPPGNMQFSEITHNSAHINWEPPQGANGYRISWVKADGLVEEEVCVSECVSRVWCVRMCVCVCVYRI